jgi:hypothetical protein
MKLKWKFLILTIIFVLIICGGVIYFFWQKLGTSTLLFVYPENVQAKVGEKIIAYIKVSNVRDLYGWEAKLQWNASMLTLLNATEGPFLRSHGNTTFFYPKPGDGSVRLECCLQGMVIGVDGGGVLASLEFIVLQPGRSEVQLSYAKLMDSQEKVIEFSFGRTCVIVTASI